MTVSHSLRFPFCMRLPRPHTTSLYRRMCTHGVWLARMLCLGSCSCSRSSCPHGFSIPICFGFSFVSLFPSLHLLCLLLHTHTVSFISSVSCVIPPYWVFSSFLTTWYHHERTPHCLHLHPHPRLQFPPTSTHYDY